MAYNAEHKIDVELILVLWERGSKKERELHGVNIRKLLHFYLISSCSFLERLTTRPLMGKGKGGSRMTKRGN